AMLAIEDTTSDTNAEYFFTRLAYSENGYRGFGRFVPKNFRCPEFGGGNYFPQQGLGWSMDSPGADCKYMGGIQRLTNLRVYPNPNMIRITDPDLFRYPYAYIVEPGGLDLTDNEVRLSADGSRLASAGASCRAMQSRKPSSMLMTKGRYAYRSRKETLHN